MMRVVIEPGTYAFDNMGDIAMLQVCLARLRRLWPEAKIRILTRSPSGIERFCPGSEPLDAAACHRWLQTENGTRRPPRFWPAGLARASRTLVRSFRRRYPPAALRWFQFWESGEICRAVRTFLEAVEDTDLFLVSGQGGFAEPFWKQAMSVLDLLDFAQTHDCRTAMMSQGLGPLVRPEVLDKARAVLPRLDLIALREDRCGLPLLQMLGVPMTRVLTSGDDAIEMAYRAAPPSIGHALGVNMRIRPYANTQQDTLRQVGSVLGQLAQEKNAGLIPVPILHRPGTPDDDAAGLGQLLNQTGRLGSCDELDTPSKVIDQIGKCRVVVAGSYHAAVFALAQGIPAVCLSGSAYYAAKFCGLAAQFGCGCEVLFLEDPAFPAKLRTAIDRAWESAEALRPALIASAARQVAAGMAAYERLREIVDPGVASASGAQAPPFTARNGQPQPAPPRARSRDLTLP